MASPISSAGEHQPQEGTSLQTRTSQPGEIGDVESALEGLVEIKDQRDLERDVSSEVKAATLDDEKKKDEGRIAGLRAKISGLQKKKEKLIAERTLKQNSRAPPRQIDAISSKILALDMDVSELFDEIVAFEERIEQRQRDAAAALEAQEKGGMEKAVEHAGPTQQEGEDRRAFLIRTGKMTPFALTGESEEESDSEAEGGDSHQHGEEGGDHPSSHQVLRQPGFGSQLHRDPIPIDDLPVDPTANNLESEFGLRPRKRARTQATRQDAGSAEDDGSDEDDGTRKRKKRPRRRRDDDDYSEGESVSSDEQAEAPPVLVVVDDANERRYKARISKWVQGRNRLRQEIEGDMYDADENDATEEWFKPTPGKPDMVIIDDYRLPQEVGAFLFPFQRIGIQWLAELHKRREGGILCDEMGLGKTVQIIAMLAALHYSKKLDGPILIVCPTTLMPQWVKHLHTWWPPLRVSLLHSTGSGMINPDLEDSGYLSHDKALKKSSAAQKIIDNVVNHCGVLITTYRGLATYIDELGTVGWGYAALDEGHTIRNRETDAAKACKRLFTFHRIVLSGTPVQNNLRELFSLFEFVYPGLLGSELADFAQHFERPIREGHHRGASTLAIVTADRTSKTLRDCVKPYMLRRIKADVADSLPPKSEQVFFCKLTDRQEAIYQRAIASAEVQGAFKGRNSRQAEVFSAIDTLRKVCSHPDLLSKENKSGLDDWGSPERSVKMQVLVNLIRIFKKFNHKALLFSQRLDVLDMVERFLAKEKISFARMDGRTNQMNRQLLVERFNSSPDLDVFLLTPQTGGLGLNLTGADRVVLFDPSWNPATDRQAIERAWRLGQTKPVKIYRLLTTGTIEEKIYRKQLYKQFVSDRVMTDTEFHQFTDTTNLNDLFMYGSNDSAGDILDDVGVNPTKKRASQADSSNDPAAAAGGAVAGAGAAVIVDDADNDDDDDDLDASASKEEARIDQVRRVEDFQPDDGADEKDMLDAVCSTSVDGAYEHDKVVGAKVVRADRRMTEFEADRLNERTVKFLREQAARAYFDRQQQGPRPPPSRGGRDKTKDQLGIVRGGGAPAARRWSLATVKPLIARYLTRAGGKARSSMLVEHFNREYSSIPSDMFTAALKQVATMQQMPRRGGSLWHLRRDQGSSS